MTLQTLDHIEEGKRRRTRTRTSAKTEQVIPNAQIGNLDDQEDERRWIESLRSSEDVLEAMIKEALEEDEKGLSRTIKLSGS